MKIRIFIFLACTAFIFSCKKDNLEVTCDNQLTDSYFPLTVGSYWIYQWYSVDSSGMEEILENKIDSVMVTKDTLIGGYQYAVLEGRYSFGGNPNEKFINYRRDSLGFLVDPQNNIYFSTTNTNDTLRTQTDVAFFISYQMQNDLMPIEVPAGNFDCKNYQGSVIPYITVPWTEQFLNQYYAEGVGLVKENTFYFSSAHISQLERRLVEYNIE